MEGVNVLIQEEDGSCTKVRVPVVPGAMTVRDVVARAEEMMGLPPSTTDPHALLRVDDEKMATSLWISLKLAMEKGEDFHQELAIGNEEGGGVELYELSLRRKRHKASEDE